MNKEIITLLLVQNKLLTLILKKEYELSDMKANNIVNKLLREAEEKVSKIEDKK